MNALCWNCGHEIQITVLIACVYISGPVVKLVCNREEKPMDLAFAFSIFFNLSSLLHCIIDRGKESVYAQ